MSSIQAVERQFWFIAGSQHLYGEETLREVERNARHIAQQLDAGERNVPCHIQFKAVATTSEHIRQLSQEAGADERCAGWIVWMHTFSPSKMWISGLAALRKPLLHLHTQYNRDIPWPTIDMDFMNLNQSAHGDREFGHIGARLGLARTVVAGHWQSAAVQQRIEGWMRTAAAYAESRSLKVARFGDNMRAVAVTEGDKVEAQIRLGWTVDGYGIGDLAEQMHEVAAADIDALCEQFEQTYELAPEARGGGCSREAVREQARMELALRRFLAAGGYTAFTTTFEDLHGLKQLPGLAVQRLMADGYGFGGEGDWKTAALVRLMKVMAGGQATSFMEDYTYHLEPGNEMVLGAHMLEVCPSIAADRPRLEVHPLSIGGKADPARLVFNGRSGRAVHASLIDLGRRFRLVVNEVEAVEAPQPLPQLPVARVLWKPEPTLAVATEAWILAGGAHHTGYSYHVTAEQLSDWAEMIGMECVIIDKNSSIRAWRNELRWNDAVWR